MEPVPLHFLQACPTCGRRLQIERELHGRRITCRHCGAELEACDDSLAPCPPKGKQLLQRADDLLAPSRPLDELWN